MEPDHPHFSGAKLALIHQQQLLVYQRDHKAGILYPGMIDLPGGGREGQESPEACVLRELNEEFGLVLVKQRLQYRVRYQVPDDGRIGYFFVASISAAEIDSIVFGDEGVRWQMMAIQDFLDHPQALAHLQQHLAHYLARVN